MICGDEVNGLMFKKNCCFRIPKDDMVPKCKSICFPDEGTHYETAIELISEELMNLKMLLEEKDKQLESKDNEIKELKEKLEVKVFNETLTKDKNESSTTDTKGCNGAGGVLCKLAIGYVGIRCVVFLSGQIFICFQQLRKLVKEKRKDIADTSVHKPLLNSTSIDIYPNSQDCAETNDTKLEPLTQCNESEQQHPKPEQQYTEPELQHSDPEPQHTDPEPHRSETGLKQTEAKPQCTDRKPHRSEHKLQEIEPELQRTDSVPQRIDSVPQRTDSAAQQTDSAPQRTDSVPQRTDYVPQRTDSVPQRTDYVPQRIDSVPQRTDSVQQTDSVPQRIDSVPHRTDFVPQPTDSVSQHTEPLTKKRNEPLTEHTGIPVTKTDSQGTENDSQCTDIDLHNKKHEPHVALKGAIPSASDVGYLNADEHLSGTSECQHCPPNLEGSRVTCKARELQVIANRERAESAENYMIKQDISNDHNRAVSVSHGKQIDADTSNVKMTIQDVKSSIDSNTELSK
ncbi:uncharacterized protein LOC128234234 [Mya arenaria]|uniref:uncharacterized protein LOC128234234 n=1 Tax=Mya arenaria TaxID=6604 RepID=UPI0022E856F3|nr:uncharacterized protein LOC128234234 [Mya arenaria]